MTQVYYETYLPNFEFKNGEFFLKFKNPIKIDIMKKIVWINELPINIKLYNHINSVDFGKITYKIINDENDNSNKLKIKIYENDMDLSYHIGDVIKDIEYQILEIYTDHNIDSNNISYDSNEYKTVYSRRATSPNNKLISNNYDDDSNYYSDEEYL